MKKVRLSFIVLLLASPVLAKDVQIPFVTNTYEYTNATGTHNPELTVRPVMMSKKTQVTDVTSNKVEETIRNVKNTVCSVVENGSVKVYFSFDVEGKVFGVGTSSEAGIEVTFECKNQHK